MQLTSGINHVAIITADLDRFSPSTPRCSARTSSSRDDPRVPHAILVSAAAASCIPSTRTTTRTGRVGRHVRPWPPRPLRARRARPEAFDALRSRLIDRGATDGEVTDLGPKLCFWVIDPDGMRIEVDWVSDPSLAGFHAPVPVADYAPV